MFHLEFEFDDDDTWTCVKAGSKINTLTHTLFQLKFHSVRPSFAARRVVQFNILVEPFARALIDDVCGGGGAGDGAAPLVADVSVDNTQKTNGHKGVRRATRVIMPAHSNEFAIWDWWFLILAKI